jgi:hypothetical protein
MLQYRLMIKYSSTDSQWESIAVFGDNDWAVRCCYAMRSAYLDAASFAVWTFSNVAGQDVFVKAFMP